MSEIDPLEVEWLWPSRIPRGCVTILNGHAGVGKSYVTLDIAARVSRGRDWPDGTQGTSGSVVIVAGEDCKHRTIRPRLDASEADVSRVKYLGSWNHRSGKKHTIQPVTLRVIEPIERAVASLADCRLLIVDPIGSFIGGDTDSAQDNCVREVLAPLSQLAESTGIAVLIVSHSRKAAVSRADDLVLGSRAFTGLPRSVIHLMRDPADKHRKLLLPGKLNFAPQPAGLAFTVDGSPPAVNWSSKPVDVDADEIAALAGQAPRDTSKLEEAKAFIIESLADGPVLQTQIAAEAQEAGIASKTLKDAKRALPNVKAEKRGEGGAWRWRLTDLNANQKEEGQTEGT